MREKNRFVIFVGNYINMEIEIEKHPLEPFLPPKAKLLMLGSFPPQRKRWSMDFYYPNLNNDMWRIVGLLFFGDKDHFLNDTRKAFCREQIIDFLNEKGIALFDTASSIRRLQDNASDGHCRITPPTSRMQSNRHHRTEGNGYAPCTTGSGRTESRRLCRICV